MIKGGGNSQHHSQFSEVNDLLCHIWKKQKHSHLNSKSQNLFMIRTNIGLMRIYSNSYEDDNNEHKWWIDRPKFKFKHKT